MTQNMSQTPGDYAELLAEVKERVRSAQYAALRAVNQELVGLYWDIGKMIVSRQQGATWGKAVVEQLAADLQIEFAGIKGFSAANLWRSCAFYETYHESEKLAPLVREIAWTHNVLIMERCKDPLQREFYIRMTKKFGWTKNVLIHQMKSQSYESMPVGSEKFRSSDHARHSVPSQVGGERRVHVAGRASTDRRGNLPHGDAVAQRTPGATPHARGNCQASRGIAMIRKTTVCLQSLHNEPTSRTQNAVAPISTIQAKFEGMDV